MKVLADYHHGNLYYSLHLLFTKRLGIELYRPIGLDWFFKGWWRVAEPYGNAQDTIDQYLGINNRRWDAYKNLNGDYKLNDDIYHIYDPENNFFHNAITFDKFKEMKFDYIVATFPTHEDWEKLLQYQPNAKFIMQLGNEGQTTRTKNVMCSTNEFVPSSHQNTFFYHQEFDLTDYRYTPPKNHNKVSSFVVLLPEREKFLSFKEAMPDFDFRAYGPGAIDGILSDGEGISTEMRDSAFGYHNKPQGEGYGHIIHKWYASGRPCVVNYNMYKNKLAGKLLIPDVTCINLDESFDNVVKKIRYFSEAGRHKKMCENAYNQFKKVCNFESEGKDFKKWLSNL